jgi:hypothetical protein
MKVSILNEGSIRLVLQQTISLFGEIQFVENPYEANVIIAEEAKDMAPYYCKEREFIIFPEKPRGDQEAKNVHEFGILEAYQVMTFPAIHAQKDLPETLPGPSQIEKCRIENPGATRVLVIDDTLIHQKSALALLSDCDLTIATGYDEAMSLLQNNVYDIVLTDMEMPMSNKLSSHILGKLIPYGLLIATEAARSGAKQVAVVTNLNHHTDPFSAAFDHFTRHSYSINGAKVKYLHAPMINLDGEYAKDWKEAMKILSSGKEND